MSLPFEPPLAPMEATTGRALPEGDGWQYEPKWDGFRCLVFRDGDSVFLQSKAARPLARYFPEIVATFAALRPKTFVLDGELIIPRDGVPSFDDLLLRIHPAESRVRKLAAATPASFVAFDLLADQRGKPLLETSLAKRRPALESFAATHFKGRDDLLLTPATTDLAVARAWFEEAQGGLDGVVAKRLDAPYAAGERDAMTKVKSMRTADCVVGGIRRSTKKDGLASLLLGLYDADGKLNHVGFCSSLPSDKREDVTARVDRLAAKPAKARTGFTGSAPGGPSRWSKGEDREWVPLPPELVIEVEYDHFSGGRFRHATRFLRRRPDKAPEQCRMDQVRQSSEAALSLIGA